MAREADGGETGRGEGGVDNRFLYDGPFEPPLYRKKRARQTKSWRSGRRAWRFSPVTPGASSKLRWSAPGDL